MRGEQLRGIGPTDTPAIGEPPVLLAALAPLLEPAADDAAAVSAAQAVHPHLEPAAIVAARAALQRDPDAAAPRPTWRATLSLALPLGLSGQLLGLVVAGPMSVVLGDQTPRALPAWLLALLASFALGLGLLRLAPPSRAIAASLGLVGVVVGGAAIAILSSPLNGWFVALGLLALCVAHPAVGRWFDRDGRLAASVVPAAPYVVSVAWLELLVGSIRFVVPSFVKLFKETGVVLPLPTELALDACGAASSLAILLPIAPLLLALPLLRLHRRHERAALLATLTLAALVMGSLVAALGLPLLTLQDGKL